MDSDRGRKVIGLWYLVVTGKGVVDPIQDAQWGWPIYLHFLGSFGGFHVGKYTSPIEHLGMYIP